ncbi:MAG: hypothetical protein HFH70_10420 [Lachnospiraceae bacterium]|nr:hypothetical protein [Lachnospiraceae bacterium]
MRARKELFCNACGKKIQMENNILREDVFEGKKEWGYFSKKDVTLHSFIMCEDCYDKMVSSFVIPPEITEVLEL